MDIKQMKCQILFEDLSVYTKTLIEANNSFPSGGDTSRVCFSFWWYRVRRPVNSGGPHISGGLWVFRVPFAPSYGPRGAV